MDIGSGEGLEMNLRESLRRRVGTYKRYVNTKDVLPMTIKQPKINDLKFINTYKVMVNGEEYVLRKSFAREFEHLINHIHFVLSSFNIHVEGNICFRCGKIFEKQITSHHALPNMLKAKYNMFVPLCDGCHLDLNNLYKKNNNKI